MNHLIDKIESYARHFQMEAQGHRNSADEKYSDLHKSLSDHSQAVGRASVVAYREGLSGAAASPNFMPWEREAWEIGAAEAGRGA